MDSWKNRQKRKPMPNCTGFIFCAFHDFLPRKVLFCFFKESCDSEADFGCMWLLFYGFLQYFNNIKNCKNLDT